MLTSNSINVLLVFAVKPLYDRNVIEVFRVLVAFVRMVHNRYHTGGIVTAV